MRMLSFAVASMLLCVSCATTPDAQTVGHKFIGEWTRGEPSSEGQYREHFVVTKDTCQYFENGNLVMSEPTVVKDGKLILQKYNRVLGGAWGRLRNNDMSLDLFGNVKGLLCFDRKTQNKPLQNTSQ